MMKHFIRIVLFTMSLYITTHVVVFFMLPLAVLCGALGRTQELQHLKVMFAKIVFRIVGQHIQVSDLQSIYPDTHYLIVANYPSGYALFALILLSPNASFIAHEFISHIPLLGQVMRQLGTIFVNSKYPLRAYREIDKALERRISGDIIILPEGQRSPDGNIHQFKRGFIHILRRGNFNLLPVTLNGFYKLKPINRIYLDPDAKLEILVHSPISNEKIKEMSDIQLIETVECIVKEQYKP